jgi:hypothetical protein
VLRGEKLHNKFLEMSTATTPLTSSHNSKMKNKPIVWFLFHPFWPEWVQNNSSKYVHLQKRNTCSRIWCFFLFKPGGHLLRQINKHTHENIYFCIFNVRFLYVYSTSDMFSWRISFHLFLSTCFFSRTLGPLVHSLMSCPDNSTLMLTPRSEPMLTFGS